MPARYSALDTRSDHDVQDDMEAAFDYSEDDDDNDASETQPLNPDSLANTSLSPQTENHPQRIPGVYDFENVDYDYPPPGSPPPPSAIALPNNFGNSNGFVPQSIPTGVLAPRKNWLRRSFAAILPTDLAQLLGVAPQRPQGAIGGGVNNDGVFANVTAKPTRSITVIDGDEIYLVPEETRSEAPPSYASAQADAVPPYWETTVHAPFSPGASGEVMVDNLPTGSVFSFLWNMLVSISFQFIGFLLTYLLHTTHAARLGSRAGLGVTLIQYGFALRGRLDNAGGSDGEGWSGWGDVGRPTTTDGTPPRHNHHGMGSNTTHYVATPISDEQANAMVADATTEWLSFFLMTIGWFILLTSLLGFWRVKRWERGVLASQRDNSNGSTDASSPLSLFSRIERNFSLRGSSRLDLLRQGFGLGRRRSAANDEASRRAEEGLAGTGQNRENAAEAELMIPLDPNDPNRSSLIAETLAQERRLQRDLRNAGLL